MWGRPDVRGRGFEGGLPQQVGVNGGTLSLFEKWRTTPLMKLVRLKNKRSLALRFLLGNRYWAVVNRTLFMRSHGFSGPGVQQDDWIYRRVFSTRTRGVPHVMALVVDLGRLGNALLRLSKAAVVASENGWGGIVVPRLGHFPAYSAMMMKESFEVDGFFATCGDGGWGSAGVPDFLVRREYYSEPIEPNVEMRNSVKRVVRRLFPGLETREDITGNDLVIHVRSGDIYFRERVGNWGQPPVAYYEKIIREEQWSRVFVVCEDNESPVLLPIAALCDSLGIEHFFQSGTLAEDLALLASATNLVVGRGTFAPAIVLLNMALEKVFFFEDRFDSKFVDPSTELVRVVDEQGTYRESVLQGGWVNSEEQRKLMVSYPTSALGFEGKRS